MIGEKEREMTDKQKRALLGVARKVIEATVRGEKAGGFESEDPLFNEQRGCFVTMHNQGELRGCIGNFQPSQGLIQTIREMAVAATKDYRFSRNPVTPGELDQIDIEISVLSPLAKTDEPLGLELGKHGIYIQRGTASGCFLPQVATETGWSKEEFLSNCCAGKAGMTPDAWKQPDTDVLLFTAEVFGEKEMVV